MTLDEFLTQRTVCRILKPDEQFTAIAARASSLPRIKVKIIRSLAAETQSFKWAQDDVVLVDSMMVEYASAIFDIMMSSDANVADRRATMQGLIYKQWARSFFVSGFSLQSWLLLNQSRKLGNGINYSDGTTPLSRHIAPNLKDGWEDLSRAFIFAHELGHVLHRRGELNVTRYSTFLADTFPTQQSRPMMDKKLLLARLRRVLSRLGAAEAAGLDLINRATLERTKPRDIHKALEIELLCDLYACDFIVDNYRGDSLDADREWAPLLCYLLPICVEVMSFLKIGIANRRWVEYMIRRRDQITREYGVVAANDSMDAVVDSSYESQDSYDSGAHDSAVRLIAIRDFMVRSIGVRKAHGAPPRLDRTELSLQFVARFWAPYRHMLDLALGETGTGWLNNIWADANDARAAATNGGLPSSRLDLPSDDVLSGDNLDAAVSNQFLIENGF